MRSALAEGALAGFVCGLGAATADAVYASIAGSGLTFISEHMLGQQGWLRFLGGAFLCWLGGRVFFSHPPGSELDRKDTSSLGGFTSTFVLTLMNPMTILSFAAIFAGLGVGSTHGNYGSAAFMVSGVFVGSSLWWLILSGTVGMVRHRCTTYHLAWINRISGIIIAVFGLLALMSLT